MSSGQRRSQRTPPLPHAGPAGQPSKAVPARTRSEDDPHGRRASTVWEFREERSPPCAGEDVRRSIDPKPPSSGPRCQDQPELHWSRERPHPRICRLHASQQTSQTAPLISIRAFARHESKHPGERFCTALPERPGPSTARTPPIRRCCPAIRSNSGGIAASLHRRPFPGANRPSWLDLRTTVATPRVTALALPT